MVNNDNFLTNEFLSLLVLRSDISAYIRVKRVFAEVVLDKLIKNNNFNRVKPVYIYIHVDIRCVDLGR